MRKIYWWTNIIEKPLSDLDLAIDFLNDKVNFKFYCPYNCCWVEIHNITSFEIGTDRIEIIADIKVFKNIIGHYIWTGHYFYKQYITKVQRL